MTAPYCERRALALLRAGATIRPCSNGADLDLPGIDLFWVRQDVLERVQVEAGATCTAAAPEKPLATPSAGLADFLAAAQSRPTPDSSGKRA